MSSLGPAFVELLIRYFGEAAEPTYGRTLAIAERDPYRPLRERLSRSDDLHDSTDWQYDLGPSWWFQRGDTSWNLRLSFVGPFSVLIRYDSPNHREVVTEHALLDAALAEGFVALAPEVLETPVRIWEPEVEGVLYEFLFEFDKGTPWAAVGRGES